MSEQFNEIEKHYTVQYGNIITMLSQQTMSKLESCVIVKGGIRGRQAVAADQIGEFQFAPVKQRLEDTPLYDINRDRRWYEFLMQRGGVPLDDIDDLRTTLDVKSPIVTAGMAGVNRAKDQEILRGYYGPNKTGENGEKIVNFKPGNIIPFNFAGGDILKKLNRGIELFRQGEVDYENEEVYQVVNSVAATKLREAGVYVNILTMDQKPLTGKKLTPYAGITFVELEKVPFYMDGGKRVFKLPLFCKSGVGLGKWQDTKIRVGELQGKSYAWHVFMQFALGATRLEEVKCLSNEVKED